MPVKRMRVFAAVLLICTFAVAAATRAAYASEVTARLEVAERSGEAKLTRKLSPAVLWLTALDAGTTDPVAPGKFTLLQKNKMFTPHLLVVPVGSSVAFPNADPFFHNVFSLFDGKRFDLGLYEAGSTRSVLFPREGVSYIFCNIHSEMSAVVISLNTPFYSIADAYGLFHLRDVPAGNYELHVWIEGQRQSFLDQLTRRVHVASDGVNLGVIQSGKPEALQHLNKFGRPYEPDANPIY